MKQWQVWTTFASLVVLALIAMGLITRSSIVMESAQRASLLNALRARLEISQQQQVSAAARRVDQILVDVLVMESLRSPLDYQSLPPLAGWFEPNPALANWQYNTYAQAYFQLDGSSLLRGLWQANVDPQRLVTLLQTLRWQEDLPGPLSGQSMGWLLRAEEMYRVNSLIQRPSRPSLMPFPLPDSSARDDRQRRLLETLATAPKWIPEKYPETGDAAAGPRTVTAARIVYGPIYPIWLQDQLFLVRRVTLERPDSLQDFLQGCWVDWRRLSGQLLRAIRDNLPPGSSLEAVTERPLTVSGGFASWAPLRVVTPPVELPSREMPLQGGWLNLLVGWVFMLVAGLAVGMLLHTVMRESRRRETFVSAVTHELRTPLTAFRLYTDLLAKNPDPQKTRLYAKTLESEAERLSHLVENVLTYSRLERRGITSHHRVVEVGTLLDAIMPRLDEHCARNQMIMDYHTPSAKLRQREILTDPSAVERILFNLVDNACKYGKTPDETMVQLIVESDAKDLMITVRDFGLGISAVQRRRLFQAYNHGQISTDSPNKTIGLGLHISQQLAVALGGRLIFTPADPGASFQLNLPLSASG